IVEQVYAYATVSRIGVCSNRASDNHALMRNIATGVRHKKSRLLVSAAFVAVHLAERLTGPIGAGLSRDVQREPATRGEQRSESPSVHDPSHDAVLILEEFGLP